MVHRNRFCLAVEKAILTPEECLNLVSAVRMGRRKHDIALILALLFCGAKARKWTWGTAAQDFAEFPLVVYEALRDLAASKKLDLSVSYSDLSLASNTDRGVLDHAVFSASGNTTPLTTQDVTRQIKRYSRRAGIQKTVNLRTLSNTCHAFRRQFDSAAEAADWLFQTKFARSNPSSSQQPFGEYVKLVVGQKDPRLHGIGRRTKR